jgi:hypothetical protein
MQMCLTCPLAMSQTLFLYCPFTGVNVVLPCALCQLCDLIFLCCSFPCPVISSGLLVGSPVWVATLT